MRESSLATVRARGRLALVPASSPRPPRTPPSMHHTPRVAADLHATPPATMAERGPDAAPGTSSTRHQAAGAVLLILSLGAIVLASVALTASLAVTGG